MAFKQGVSGNPEGRPKGTGYRQKLFNRFIEPHTEALIDTAIKLALEGNEAMIRLFLERMLPARPTDNTITLDVPEGDITEADMILAYGEKILNALCEGMVSPQQAKTLMSTIEIQRKNIETAELADRVAAIEYTLKQRKER